MIGPGGLWADQMHEGGRVGHPISDSRKRRLEIRSRRSGRRPVPRPPSSCASARLSADLYKHLVQVPTIIASWPEVSEPPGIAVSELELKNPTAHGLVRHVEAAPVQQILDVSEARREAAIEPYGVLDDLGRESVAAIGDRLYHRRPDYCHSTRKPIAVTAPQEGQHAAAGVGWRRV